MFKLKFWLSLIHFTKEISNSITKQTRTFILTVHIHMYTAVQYKFIHAYCDGSIF